MSKPTKIGCRISRVRPKLGGAEISLLPTRPAPDETNFVPTLVWVIDQARRGKVRGYALVVVIEDDASDAYRTIEAAKAFEETDTHHVLGAIRRMEANYMQRSWPAEDE